VDVCGWAFGDAHRISWIQMGHNQYGDAQGSERSRKPAVPILSGRVHHWPFLHGTMNVHKYCI
jgi:hypothetical protein